jgi:hypothetical protein
MGAEMPERAIIGILHRLSKQGQLTVSFGCLDLCARHHSTLITCQPGAMILAILSSQSVQTVPLASESLGAAHDGHSTGRHPVGRASCPARSSIHFDPHSSCGSICA